MDYEKNPISDWKFLGDKPAIIDFYAPWCGPCRMLLPIIEELSSEYEGKVDIYKVNVDEESALAAKFGIMSIPTVIVFRNGEIFEKSLGVVPKDSLAAIIEKALK